MTFIPSILACILGHSCIIALPDVKSDNVAECVVATQAIEQGMMNVSVQDSSKKVLIVSAQCLNQDQVKTLLEQNKDKVVPGPDGSGAVINLDGNDSKVPPGTSDSQATPDNGDADHHTLKPLTPEEKARGDVQL